MQQNLRYALLITTILLVVYNTTFAQSSTIGQVTCITTDLYQYDKVEFDISIDAAFDNPYRSEDISVDMIISTPSARSITLPCFYVSGTTSSLWKARLTPQESGVFQYKIELKKAGVLEASSVPATVTIQPSAENGFVHKKNNNVFQFDSGNPFRGVGENIAWEGRSWESENYNYEYFLGTLKANGGNFFRTWMSAWNLPLEWKTVVDTKRYSNSTNYFHPGGIERMDELVDLCDSLDIYMMLTLGWHGELQTGDRWNINVYNVANGGPANTPTDFFTNESAKAQYKNRLRYIIARWGYSTSIGAWEFFNEIDNAVYNGTESQIAIPHAAVTQWHQEMSAYLKELDPYDHLITTSISHREISGLFDIPDLDFVQKHLYKVTGSIPETIQSYDAKLGKPFVVGEFGYDWDWNNITDANGANLDFDYKRGLWYGLFSATPILPLSWWWEFFNQRLTDRSIAAVRKISDEMLYDGGGEFTPLQTTSSGNGFETMGVKCGSRYFIYLLNNTTSSVNDRSVTINIPDGVYRINRFDTETMKDSVVQNVAASGGKILLENLQFSPRQSIVLTISSPDDNAGIQLPFNDVLSIPGRIEAEEFDKGGESVSYHDRDELNTGGAFRENEGVDIKMIGDNAYVTDMTRGEWMEYSVDVQKDGLYEIRARMSSQETGKTFSMSIDGSNVDVIFATDVTNIENEWDSVVVSAILPKGEHTLRLQVRDSGLDLDALDFKLLNVSPTVVVESPGSNSVFEAVDTVKIAVDAFDEDGIIEKVQIYGDDELIAEISALPYEIRWKPSSGLHSILVKAIDDGGLTTTSEIVRIEVKKSLMQTPFPDAMLPHAIPGKIEAEDFDSGDDGVACHDNTPGNVKGFYRTDVDPDIEQCTDSDRGFNLADIQAGEWVEYTVNAAVTGNYNFVFRVATMMDAQKFNFYVDDQLITGQVAVPNTGSWQTWKDLSINNVSLKQGDHVLKLSFLSEFFNLNYIDVSQVAITSVLPEIVEQVKLYPNPSNGNMTIEFENEQTADVRIFDTHGREVYNAKSEGRSMEIHRSFTSGIYIVKVTHRSGVSEVLKAIIK